jgi:hypothetical protein
VLNRKPLPRTHPLKAKLFTKLQAERATIPFNSFKLSSFSSNSAGVYAEINFEDYGISSIEDLIDLSEEYK